MGAGFDALLRSEASGLVTFVITVFPGVRAHALVTFTGNHCISIKKSKVVVSCSEVNKITINVVGIKDLQIGVRVQLANLNPFIYVPELSLLPVADQLKRKLSVGDWCEI